MAGPTVSVVVPTYQRGHLIARAVLSALAVLLPGDEVVVADDGSTDRTGAVVSAIRGPVRFVPGPHAGAGVTRNRGVAAARGDLVAFLDSDDEFLPGKLAIERALFAARPDVLFSFSDFAVGEEDGARRPRYLKEWHGDPRPWSEILGGGTAFSSVAALPEGVPDFPVHVGRLYEAELDANYVATFTLVVRRREAGALLSFAEDVPYAEDWECFARLARAGPCAYLDVETAVQHGHAGPRISGTDVHRAAEAHVRVMERVWGADPEFLAAPGNRERLERAVSRERLRAARWLLGRGRAREAREALRLAPTAPLAYRALARLPGPVLRGLMAARRRFQGGTPA